MCVPVSECAGVFLCVQGCMCVCVQVSLSVCRFVCVCVCRCPGACVYMVWGMDGKLNPPALGFCYYLASHTQEVFILETFLSTSVSPGTTLDTRG